jgi:hypothetical protein
VDRHLEERVRELLDRNLGRARAALQRDLDGRASALETAVSSAFHEHSAGLAQAHATAVALHDEGAATIDAEVRRLTGRIQSLADLSRQLTLTEEPAP